MCAALGRLILERDGVRRTGDQTLQPQPLDRRIALGIRRVGLLQITIDPVTTEGSCLICEIGAA